jgi:L-asparagine oxygenase
MKTTDRAIPIDLDRRERGSISLLASEVSDAAACAPATLADLTADAAASLPSRLIDLARQARARPPRCSSWIVRGLPVERERLGPTPASWRERGERTTVEECALLLIGEALGNVFAWADQQGGATVHDIVPSAGEEDSLLSSSSTKEMSLHTEDAFFAERADLVLLLCLRNPSVAPTYVSDVNDIELSEEPARLVRGHRYFFRPDGSHSGSGPELDSGGFPVVQANLTYQAGPSALVSDTDSGVEIRFDSDYIDAPDDKAALDAAKALELALHQARTEIVLQPGELLIVDNKRCVHGRGGFQASLDGRDRWLKRVNISMTS